MILREKVEQLLEKEKRNLTWLATEMDKSYTGFKLSLENETIKYSDIKRVIEILKVPVTELFEKQYGGAAVKAHVSEPEGFYKKEIEVLRENIVLLKNAVKDKDKIIELMSK